MSPPASERLTHGRPSSPLQVYCSILVIALAAIVPRKKTRFLTAAGAGALSTFYLQGFGLPAVAPLLFRILDCLFPIGTNQTQLWPLRTVLAMGALVALLSVYAVLSAALVSRVISAVTSGSRWKYKSVAALLVVLALEAHGHGTTNILLKFQEPQPTEGGWASLNVTSPPKAWSEPYFLQNSVFGRVNLRGVSKAGTIIYLGMVDSLQACVAAADEKGLYRFTTSVVWYRGDAKDSGSWARTCFATFDGKENAAPFQPGQPKADTVRNFLVQPKKCLVQLDQLCGTRPRNLDRPDTCRCCHVEGSVTPFWSCMVEDKHTGEKNKVQRHTEQEHTDKGGKSVAVSSNKPALKAARLEGAPGAVPPEGAPKAARRLDGPPKASRRDGPPKAA